MRKKFLVSLFTILVFGGCGHELENGNSTDGDSSIGGGGEDRPRITSWSVIPGSSFWNTTIDVTVDRPVAFAGISAIDDQHCFCYWSISHCGSTPAPPPTCGYTRTEYTFPTYSMRCFLDDGSGNSCTPTNNLTLDGVTWNPIYDTNGAFKCWNLNNLIPDNC